eukprot:gene6302-6537_t
MGAGQATERNEGVDSLPVISVGQVSFCLVYLWAIGLYLYAVLLQRTRKPSMSKAHLSDADIESKTQEAAEAAGLINGDAKAAVNNKPVGITHDFGSSQLVSVEFGSILVWFYMCDRTNIFWQSEKWYDRDLFMFLFFCLTIVALACSLQPVRTPLLLNRPQTEEWKGWMQVLFLLYHYFEAREMYNAIRIFIAGYVWMTGFGNFSYYYRTGDFSIGRFCQMMWRLNFLVIFCCIVLQNSYMLYYICPMHTIFTVFVYACLAIAPSLNKSTCWMWTKIALCFALIFVLWDIKSVFYAIWTPFDWLVGYTDPRKGKQDRLHEWYFRSGLDRYIWIWGMVCAYIHPYCSKLLNAIEELPRIKQYAVRVAVLALCAVAFAVYYIHIYSLPKIEYNKVHPYTSWIPLTLWVVVRNITPKMRIWSMRLYGWLGCITLETYLCQFHIWLHSDIPNGQPKYLLSLLPGSPMMNFALVTALYIYVSNRLFHLTNDLKDKVVPHDDNRLLVRNCLQMAIAGALAAGLGWLAKETVVMHLL